MSDDKCKDCQNFQRCQILFRCSEESTTCDWTPSRFLRVGRVHHIDLSTLTPDAAGAELAKIVTTAPRVTCPECGAAVRTYSTSGATLIEYHRAGTWCNGSDLNLSEAAD